MRRRSISPGLLLGFLILVLGSVSCGGGSDSSSSDPRFTIHWGSPQLTAHFFHNQSYLANTYATPVDASVSGTIDPVPSGIVYVLVTVHEPVFTGGSILAGAGNSFSLSMTPDMQLAAGTYSGAITLQMFQDAAHTKPYAVTGGTLPYTLTVDEELTVTVEVDGVPVAKTFSSSNTAVTEIWNDTIYWYPLTPASSLSLASGQVLTLRSSVPVTWYSPDSFYPYGSLWGAPTVTDTTLTQTIPSFTNGMLGSSYIAMPKTGTQWGAGFLVDVP